MPDSAAAFAPINPSKLNGAAPVKAGAQWEPVLPVPADAPEAPKRHVKLGSPSMIFTYRDRGGACLGHVIRFDTKDGKQFRPLVFYRSTETSAFMWRWESWPAPRPLYGLDRLAARPDAPVMICEGEKAADAAQRLCPDHVSITSPNGAKSAAKADWTPLRGRHVIIWHDADEPGAAYAAAVAKILKEIGAARVTIAQPPQDVAEGWDAADAEAQGWSHAQAADFIAAAKLETDAPPQEEQKGIPKRKSQRDMLMSLCDDLALWHGPDYEPYASIPIKNRCQNWPIRSAAFKRWLSNQAYEKQSLAPGGQAVEDTLRVLEARAVGEGPEKTPWRRVGSQDGRIYIDLGDADWRAVEINTGGWKIIPGDGLPFLRSPRMRPLCEPEAGFSIGDLYPFVNVAGDDDFFLVVAFLVAALRPRGPYPILILNGEHGSGKSNLCRRLRSLIDPSKPAHQGPPKDEQNLIIAAQNTHLIAFDNISHIDAELADGLARLSTGSGFAVRALHTDREENLYEGACPLIINGIPALADRADLNDRAIIVRLETIDDVDRRPEEELDAGWEIARPRVLGVLCDALSAALRNLPATKLARYGRMADFEKWMTAAEPGLGWAPGTFSAAYGANRANAAAATFEADPVAVAIETLIFEDHPRGWTGTATRLLDLLEGKISDSLKRSNAWPRGPSGLGNRLERVKPILRQRGLIIERRHSGTREISIFPKMKLEIKEDTNV